MTQRSDLVTLLGERIRTLRKQKKLTILTLATICSISEKHLGQIERGKSNATIDLLDKIAKALDITVPMLFIEHNETIKSNNFNEKSTPSIEKIILELQEVIENAEIKTLQRIYRVVKACQD